MELDTSCDLVNPKTVCFCGYGRNWVTWFLFSLSIGNEGREAIKIENIHSCQAVGRENTSDYWFYDRKRSILVRWISSKICTETLGISRAWRERGSCTTLLPRYQEHHRLKEHLPCLVLMGRTPDMQWWSWMTLFQGQGAPTCAKVAWHIAGHSNNKALPDKESYSACLTGQVCLSFLPCLRNEHFIWTCVFKHLILGTENKNCNENWLLTETSKAMFSLDQDTFFNLA